MTARLYQYERVDSTMDVIHQLASRGGGGRHHCRRRRTAGRPGLPGTELAFAAGWTLAERAVPAPAPGGIEVMSLRVGSGGGGCPGAAAVPPGPGEMAQRSHAGRPEGRRHSLRGALAGRGAGLGGGRRRVERAQPGAGRARGRGGMLPGAGSPESPSTTVRDPGRRGRSARLDLRPSGSRRGAGSICRRDWLSGRESGAGGREGGGVGRGWRAAGAYRRTVRDSLRSGSVELAAVSPPGNFDHAPRSRHRQHRDHGRPVPGRTIWRRTGG